MYLSDQAQDQSLRLRPPALYTHQMQHYPYGSSPYSTTFAPNQADYRQSADECEREDTRRWKKMKTNRGIEIERKKGKLFHTSPFTPPVIIEKLQRAKGLTLNLWDTTCKHRAQRTETRLIEWEKESDPSQSLLCSGERKSESSEADYVISQMYTPFMSVFVCVFMAEYLYVCL